MDSSLKIVKPKLSESHEPGTNALNAYHLAGQLLVIYGLVEKMSFEDSMKDTWEASEITLIGNIGELYEVWNSIKDQGNYGIVIEDSLLVRRKIIGLSHRLDQVQNSVNNWTSISKMPSILMKCEIRWQRIIQSFMDASEDCTVKITSLMADSRERHRLLNDIWQYYQKEKARYKTSLSDSDSAGLGLLETAEVSLKN